jgi:deazaflavin-dependent oxidoreductase (nitroreductase family)
VANSNGFNTAIIQEFRANEGKVGGPFAGAPPLLLTTTGTKSGERETTPVMYPPDSDRLVVFASHAGAPTNPARYHSLVADPTATVEVGTDTFDVDAAITSGAERDRLFARQAELYPPFAGYQEKTTRTIPVIALARRG